MDSYLVDFLSSSKAWVLIGSGPSIERGYPSWGKLAEVAMKLVSNERAGEFFSELEKAYKRKDYPRVFDEVKSIMGGERLVQHLRIALKPSNPSRRIYDLIAQWPVPVYLTTNFDNEINESLTGIKEAYLDYNNSEDHLRNLNAETRGAIFKLHGDLRSETGLVLTTSQYEAIDNSSEWEYWRTKLTSIFQMQRLVIVGYSLSDPHIMHILERSKKGSSVEQPICWIAPDVAPSECRDYLERYNIRVIPYRNKDGQHKNLLRLLETVSDFIPKRISVSIKQQVKTLISTNYEINSAAPGYFVFNKLMSVSNFDEKRVSMMLAAIQSVIPKLQKIGLFTLKEALVVSGWPESLPLSIDFERRILEGALQEKILFPVKDKFEINPEAEQNAQANLDSFLQLKKRFLLALKLRILNKFPDLHNDAEKIAEDIAASLTTYFKEGGLTLASALFSNGKLGSNLPSSIIKFIQESSSQYEDILWRQAFFTISVDAFVKAGEPEREYLGRIAQGFFAIHASGAFGDIATEHLREAKNTVWILDSSLQIHSLALASSLNLVFNDCLLRLREMGIRLFATRKLFEEVINHLWFANHIIKEYGSNSYHVINAARGDAPYDKSNVFLEGFIRWRILGKSNEWDSYLYQMFGESNLVHNNLFTELGLQKIEGVLNKIGIEIVDLKDWPGYSSQDNSEIQQYKEKIVSRLTQQVGTTLDYDQLADPDKKASPESEILGIVQKERDGHYHMLSSEGIKSEAWFISETSMLNAVVNGSRITWQPDAFLRFTSTLFPASTSQMTEQAFEILLLELAKVGVNLLDDEIIENVFSGLIDQAEISMDEQRLVYQQTLGDKYGEDPKSVIARIKPVDKPLAVIQLSGEMARIASERQKQSENNAQKAIAELHKANLELTKVDKYRRKLQKKKFENERKKKKNKSKKK